MENILVVASESIPGYNIIEIGSIAFATSIDLGFQNNRISQAISAFSSIIHGSDEVGGEQVQNEYGHAVMKLMNTARKNNFNAIINLRFDSIYVPTQQMICVTAYGTLCNVIKS